MNEKGRILKKALDWAGTIGLALSITFVLELFVFQTVKVEGSSMEPTLYNNDKVLVSKLDQTFGRHPQPGQIVIIDSRIWRERAITDDLVYCLRNNLVGYLFFNIKDEYYWVKRVIGIEGDIIEFSNSIVFVNGVELEEEYLGEVHSYGNTKRVVVPPGHVFVMGDNRKDSHDSRIIGCIPLDHVVGRYMFSFTKNRQDE